MDYFVGQLVEFVNEVEHTHKVVIPLGTKGIIVNIYTKSNKGIELLKTWPLTVAVNSKDYPALIPTDPNEIRTLDG